MKSALLALGLLAVSIAASAQWSDNFDSYANGSGLDGQGNWHIWYSGGNDATVTNAKSVSAPNSMLVNIGSDLNQYSFNGTMNSGKWTFKVMTYYPSTAFDDAYVILMNQYTPTHGADSWSLQVKFDNTLGIVESEWDLATLPLITDKWVEFRAEIDLTNDLYDEYYDNAPLATGLQWTTNVSGSGILNIANCDLFSSLCDEFYYDDVSIKKAGGGPETVNVDKVTILIGNYGAGTLASFTADDNDYYRIGAKYNPTDPAAVVNATMALEGHAAATSYTSGTFTATEKCSTSNAKYRIRLQKNDNTYYVALNNQATQLVEDTFTPAIPSPVSDFVNATTKLVRSEIRAASANKTGGFFLYYVDVALWTLTP